MTGTIIRADYALLQFLVVTDKVHFINALDSGDSSVKLDGNSALVRSQLDLLFRF